MKENLYDNNKLDENQLYNIINDYINNNIELSSNTNKNLEQLKKLGYFIEKFQDKFDLQLCQYIIGFSDKLSALLKNIVENNSYYMKLNVDAIPYLLIDTYCTIHNIDLDNSSDDLDGAELSDFIDDDVQAYFKEVGRIPLLSSEEEKRLLIEISNGNKKTRKKFIESNLRLVISIARKYVGRGLSFDDLIAEGNIGLIKAVDRFDVSKGFSFYTYARWWVRQSITNAIYNCSRNVRIPVRLTLDIYKYKKARDDLSKNLKHEPSCTEIAEALDISEDYAKVLHEHQFDTVSLNSKIYDDEDDELGDVIISNEELLEETIVNQMSLEFIKKLFYVLTEREVMILSLRFGLDDGVAITLEETGRILNITRERVRQIEAKALKKLKIEFERMEYQQQISEQQAEQKRKIRIDNNISMDSSKFANFQKIYNQIDSGRLTKK